MNKIPQEIFLDILSDISNDPKDLLPYVTVSRRFQYAIEPSYYRQFVIKNYDLPMFSTLFRETQAHRKGLLEKIYLETILPSYNNENCQQNAIINNYVFSAAVLKLFQVLESLNDNVHVNGGGIYLKLDDISSPSDARLRKKHERALFGTHIRLVNHEKLPVLTCVSQFSCGRGSNSRKYDPISMLCVASKLKNLQLCWIDYCDDPDYCTVKSQREIRHAFAKALSTYPRSLPELEIAFSSTCPLDEGTTLPDLIPSSMTVDPFNLALHKFIERSGLSSLSFSAQHIISPEFFWPYDDANKVLTSSSQIWLNMREIF
ncbi:hypothetical protein AJ79_09801 [Helicocarpus griseus UAMH5409]|uniref:Uncharacterized protein n=1 Tax=Helicocarpus griseus UAMH5409 TaxID=1447875 RepID=A0A2B7WH09_9EURO|nr:hypothetical protein AJ79_09801 [Helicocarpus griseus UAMH5409]